MNYTLKLKEMYSKTELVTPQMARMYLSTSPGNRKISIQKVRAWKEKMDQGKFARISQGIAFDKENRLINGHHRLTAIIQHGGSIPLYVTYNEDRENYKYYDCGMSRSTSDRTGIPKNVAAVLSTGFRVVHSKLESDVDAILRVSELPYGIVAMELEEYCGTIIRYFSQAPIRAAVVLSSLQGDKRYAFEQYRALVLQDYGSMSPITTVFCRNAMKGKYGKTGGIPATLNAFAYGMKVFDVRNSGLNQIKSTPDFLERCQVSMRLHLGILK
jgi:hypothetical protein